MAGSGGGRDRMSGCRAEEQGHGQGEQSDVGCLGSCWGLAGPCVPCFPDRVFIESGQPYRKPGGTSRSHQPRVSHASQHCVPLCWSGLEKSCWRETFSKGKLRHAVWLLASGSPCRSWLCGGKGELPAGRMERGRARLAAEGMAAPSCHGADREFSTGVWIRPKLSR